MDIPHVPYAATVIGATGAVGGALVRELLAAVACARVVALVRRQVDSFATVPGSEKLQFHMIDFSDTESATRQCAAGCEVAFCTMGIEGMPNLVSPAGMVETPRLQAKRRAW